MDSSRIRRVYLAIVSFHSHLGVVPFKWSAAKKGGKRDLVRKSRWQFYLAKGTLIVPLLQAVFLWYRLLGLLIDGNGFTFRKFWIFYATVTLTGCLIHLKPHYFEGGSMPAIINNLVATSSEWHQGKECPHCKGGGKGVVIALALMQFLGGILQPLSHAIPILRNPEHVTSVTSILSDPRSTGIGVRLAAVAFHYYAMEMTLGCYVVNAATMIIVATTTARLLACMRNRLQEMERVNDTEVSVFVKQMKMKKMNLLLIVFNTTYGTPNVVMEMLLIFSSVVYLSTFILTGAVQGFTRAVPALAALVALYHSQGRVYEESNKLLALCDGTSRGPEMRRELRATQRLRIRLGSLFYADRSLVLTILSVVLQTTATIVLGWRG